MMRAISILLGQAAHHISPEPMPDRTESRRELLRPTLLKDEVDALIVSSEPNVRYLTGFTGDSTVLILAADRALVVSDGRYETQLAEECPGLEARIRPVSQPLWPAVAEAIGLLGIRRAAFEASLTVAEFQSLREASKTTEFQAVQGRVEALRAIKDDEEIQAIRRAIRAAEDSFTTLLAEPWAGRTETELAGALEYQQRRRGAEKSSFDTIVAAGPRAALPHARPTGEVVDGAELILIDWGAVLGGYRSDLTRVRPMGKVTPRFEAVYRAVLEAQARAIAAIRPGVPARDVDAEARSVLREAGFGDFFRHALGHGLGLETHEGPGLRSTNEAPLEAGMVVTVEPGVYLPGWGGVRIEDDILVTPDGAEVLSSLPKSFESLLAQ